MNSSQNRICTLHNQPFEYFCQKCYEPTCRNCTVIGPHNTPIHSISSLPNAYERRVHQIKQRISSFLQNKQIILDSISTLNAEIEQLKHMKDVSIDQNERYKRKMLQQLQKHHERITNQIGLIKEQLQTKLNQINDIGHTFQNITDHIEVIASHSSVLNSLKQSLDRLTILLSRKYTFQELPKELSDLRLDLKNIQIYQELIRQKMKIILQIFISIDLQKAKVGQPNIDFDPLLKQLSTNIDQCINHNVCHYCGVAFTFSSANTLCPKNNSNLDINQFIGFCLKKPDSIRWATHRHYFAEPAKKYAFFKIEEKNNTFSIHLRALLLKLKTICLIKQINLSKRLEEADRNRTGVCNRIEMMYVLKEICGLSADQCEIMLTVCEKPPLNVYAYSNLVQRLKNIVIQAINIQKVSPPKKSDVGPDNK